MIHGIRELRQPGHKSLGMHHSCAFQSATLNFVFLPPFRFIFTLPHSACCLFIFAVPASPPGPRFLPCRRPFICRRCVRRRLCFNECSPAVPLPSSRISFVFSRRVGAVPDGVCTLLGVGVFEFAPQGDETGFRPCRCRPPITHQGLCVSAN